MDDDDWCEESDREESPDDHFGVEFDPWGDEVEVTPWGIER